MKRAIALAAILIGLIAILILFVPMQTAGSVEDVRFAPGLVSGGEARTAPELDCSKVESCHLFNLYPDRYQLSESGHDLYIWSQLQSDLFTEPSSLLRIVINRPNKKTWDIIGVQYIVNAWQVGVFTGVVYIRYTPVDTWSHKPVGFELNEEHNAIIVGMPGEDWAVVVKPIDKYIFEVKVYEFFWNK